MTDIATRPDSRPGSLLRAVLPELEAARDALLAAKRTRSSELIELAQRRLQAAVDAARDQFVPWGQIGSTLGIARGNAYKRYRQPASSRGYPRRTSA